MSSQTGKPTIVFVLGAFHTPVLFEPIVTELSQRGFPSLVIPRAAVEQAFDTSLEPYADVNAVRSKLEGLVSVEERNVVLVCHSAGGINGSRAVKGFEKSARQGQNLPGGIIHVAFIAAFMLRDGDKPFAMAGAGANWVDFGPEVWHANANAAATLFSDMDAASQQRWASELRPQNTRGREIMPGQACWDVNVPKSYLMLTNDQSMPVDAQEKMLENVKDETWTVQTLHAGHEAFLSRAKEVADFLESVA